MKLAKEERYSVKVEKVADKKFEDLKKQSFGFEPASERRTTPVIKYLAKVVDEKKEETKDNPETFFKMQEGTVTNVWDQFGKTGEVRTDLAMLSLPQEKKQKK